MPSLSWDTTLRMTKEKMEKINESDIHEFFERAKRGRLCFVGKRYSKANHKNCPDYDFNKPEKHIKYNDMNNLYGYGMMDHLPYGRFKWVEVNKENIEFILNKSDNGKRGYFVEADFDIPDELHDKFNDFAPGSEKIIVTEDMLSHIQIDMKNAYSIKVGKSPKLIPNLYLKKNYIIHYRLLKYYLSLGVVLKKVHRILKFNQKPWMKKYIEFNTIKRQEATNEADKNFFKLMNNCTYGITIENMRNRMKLRIVTNEKDFIKHASKPTFISHKIVDEDFVIIHEKKNKIVLNKPIYVGCTVLELSKLAMYEFWYGFLKKKCKNVNLLYKNTDSFIFEVIGEAFDNA